MVSYRIDSLLMMDFKNDAMKNIKLFSITNLISLLCITYLVLAVIGGVISYSPVPYWDMLNGYLGFYVNAATGTLEPWWAQHNEHRIFLSRILFWLDIRLFGGNMIFLIIINYLLILVSFIFFRKITIEKYQATPKSLLNPILLVILCLLFSWTQDENITWGFQSQFFLAQSLPLISFYLLYKAGINNSNNYFLAACCAGLLCSVSMANGIAALPIMVVAAYFLRFSIIKISGLAALSVISIYSYFYNYTPPAHHGSLSDGLINHPVEVFQYVLLYLGSPIYFATGKGPYLIAQLGGAFLIASCIYFFFKALKNRITPNIDWVLLAFLLYIGASALGTAGGRVIFGIEQALAGRYMTPILMAWIALLILYIDKLIPIYKCRKNLLFACLVIIQLVFLPWQFRSFHKETDVYFYRMIAALALELSVEDKKMINYIFPSSEWALQNTKIPREQNLSIFGNPKIKDANELLETKSNLNPDYSCQGALDEISIVVGDNNFIHLRGWLFDPLKYSSPKKALLIDQNNKIVGYIISGATRKDVSSTLSPEAIHSGFEGYAYSNIYAQELKVVTDNCYLPVSIPQPVYKISDIDWNDTFDILDEVSIVSSKEWTGTDFYKTARENLQIHGSYINGDQDTGSIKILASNGEKILYRSGPSSKNQKIIVDGVTNNLPVAIDWVLLEIKSDSTEKREVTLIDDGSEWGQWSAIAVLKK